MLSRSELWLDFFRTRIGAMQGSVDVAQQISGTTVARTGGVVKQDWVPHAAKFADAQLAEFDSRFPNVPDFVDDGISE